MRIFCLLVIVHLFFVDESRRVNEGDKVLFLIKFLICYVRFMYVTLGRKHYFFFVEKMELKSRISMKVFKKTRIFSNAL